MALTLRPDPLHPSGGHAILAGPDVAGVSALSVENVFSSQFLGPDGKWGKLRHAFAVAPAAGDPPALNLGPEIVDHVLTDLLVALRDGGGGLLGRLVWPDSIVPRRDATAGAASAREAVEPPPPPRVTVAPPEPDPVPPEPVTMAPPEDDPVAPRRPWWLILACVVVALALGGGFYARLHRTVTPAHEEARAIPPPPPPPPVDCAAAFDAKVAAAQDSSDADRVKLAEEAVRASCGAQAFGAVDGTRWETDEPAAWLQARFYDPDETAPVFRAGHAPDARAALDYYARWADRSPRQAEALKALCAAHPEAVGDNPQRKRACAR